MHTQVMKIEHPHRAALLRCQAPGDFAQRHPALSFTVVVARFVNAESAVKLRLKDSGSAEFDTLKDLVGYLDGKPIVCGQVNAKNAFGAYISSQYWIANLTNGEVLIGADQATADDACSVRGIQIAF